CFLVLAGLSSVSAAFRCRLDQVVRPECCCPADTDRDARPASAGSACCEVRSFQAGATAPSVVVPDPALAPLPVRWAPDRAPPPPRAAAAPVDLRRDRATGPPIRLLTQSFLI